MTDGRLRNPQPCHRAGQVHRTHSGRFRRLFITSDGRPRSADWARRLIDRGLLAAMDTNPGGKQRRFMIPPSEVDRFRKASMINPDLLTED